VLGESTSTAAAAQGARDQYLETLTALANNDLDLNVSLKLSQLGLDIDRSLCIDNLACVAERAAACGAFVRVDMEDHAKTDATLDLVRGVRSAYPCVGIVIQAYLRRSAADVEKLVGDDTPVRLCKGAYDEPPLIAFESKRDRPQLLGSCGASLEI
jgi:proline dehydrogenase